MPELRKDPVIGRWVIISTERARRPTDFKPLTEDIPEGPCSFCKGNESQTPPEIFAIRDHPAKPNAPDWRVRVVHDIAPVLRIEGELGRRGKGMYDVMNGVGAHEVIIETPDHIANICDLEERQIADVISSYISRLKDLEKDSRFKYVLLFKNYGRAAGGGRIKHSRSQLIATPVTPKRVKEELAGARRYFEYKERCIFCDIILQEKASGERVVMESDGIVAIAPFASRFPFELWLLPKEHNCDFSRLSKDKFIPLAKVLKTVLLKLKLALNDPPYNYIIHTAPFRRITRAKSGYWKTINEDFHWHIELIPQLTRVAGFEWGSGFYINPTPPEEAAKYLRATEVSANGTTQKTALEIEAR